MRCRWIWPWISECSWLEEVSDSRRDLLCESCAGGVGERLRLPLDAKTAAVGKLGDDVEVDVLNDLVGGGAIVLEDVEVLCARGFEDGAGDPWKDSPDGSGAFIGKLVKCGFRFFGNDQRVARAQGIDIEKGEDVGVFIDFVAGD